MRKLVFGLALAVGLSLFPAAAHADTGTDEAAFVAKINALRASKGLSALQVDANLVSKARSWSAGMAAAGRIWHSTLSDGITADWEKLGENVGMGASVDGLNDAFVASPHHYANLVDPAFTSVGIGIAMSGDTMYVTEEFMEVMPARPAPPATPPATAPPVTTTTTRKPAAPKPAAPRPAPPAPAPPVVVAAPAPVPPPAPAPAATPAAPVDPPRAPSALLVSVLERLRSFDS